MKDSETPYIDHAAINSVGSYSPNDDARRQIANKDPNRFCDKGPHIKNEDNMSEKGGY